jgi:hypothetical protein
MAPHSIASIHGMRTRLTIAVALLFLVAPTSASAQSGSGEASPPSAADRLQDGAQAIVEGMRLLLEQLQSYEPPMVMPNGDIVIRRRPPEGVPPSDPPPAPTEPIPPAAEPTAPLPL